MPFKLYLILKNQCKIINRFKSLVHIKAIIYDKIIKLN